MGEVNGAGKDMVGGRREAGARDSNEVEERREEGVKVGRMGGEPGGGGVSPGGGRRLRVYCAGPMRSGGKYVSNFHEMVRIVEEVGHIALTELSSTVEWGELRGLSHGADGCVESDEGKGPREERAGVRDGEGAAPGGRSTDAYIYGRDIHWLRRADALVAEVSGPSLGVGYEISYALHVRRIPVLCLCHRDVRSLSAMISGNTSRLMRLERYASGEEMRGAIRAFLEGAKE